MGRLHMVVLPRVLLNDLNLRWAAPSICHAQRVQSKCCVLCRLLDGQFTNWTSPSQCLMLLPGSMKNSLCLRWR